MRFAAWTDDDGGARVGVAESDTLHALPPGTGLVDLLAGVGPVPVPPPARRAGRPA